MTTRVLHLLSGAGGGSTLSTIELADGLTELGFESHAVCHHRHGTAEERRSLLDRFQGRVVFAPLAFWNPRIRSNLPKRALATVHQQALTGLGLRSAATVRAIADTRRIDLVHTETFVFADGAIAARSLGLPHVFQVRELVGPDQPFRVRGEGRRLARVLEHDRLVANSATTASLLRAVVPGRDVDVVPNGLDLGRFDAVAAGRDGRAPVGVVAMVANLNSTWKRHDRFVDTAAVVAAAHPDVEFRIYGHLPTEGRGGAYVEQLVRRANERGLGDRLVLAGFVDDPAQVMGEVDVLVQPTETESFGRVVVEAMAAGVAVVGVGRGPLGELIEDGRSGLLADDATETALAEVVERVVVDDELRAKIVAAAQDRAHELFSVDRCAERMAAIYEQELSRGARPAQPLVRSWAAYTPARFLG